LEQRNLLSAGGIAAVGPQWFGDYVAAGQAQHAGAPANSVCSVATSSSSTSAAPAAKNVYDWIVQFNTADMSGITSTAQCSRLLSNAGGASFEIIEGLGMRGEVLVRSSGASASAASALLQSDHNVATYELDSTQQFEKTPTGSQFSTLWNLANTGQQGGTPGADINATAAWNISTGSHNIVVAVLDTGVDYTDGDLAANMWTNPLDTAANNYDGDGFAGDIHGYNFVGNNGDTMDDNGHGTSVAGIIGADNANGQGVVGVNWSVSIMALKFLDANGVGYDSDAIRAINYMTMMRTTYNVNVRVVNASFGGGNYDPVLAAAIASAGNAGILFVTAAGNSGTSNDTTPQFPANYGSAYQGNAGLTNVISVAASDRYDHLASFSCYGPNTVDLAAPGVSIYSTAPGGGYATMSGTSMASPQVAGVAALAWSVDPNATLAQIKSAILQGADPIAALAGKVRTGGRLDAYNTLRLIQQDITPAPAPTPAVTPTPSVASLVAAPGSVQSGATVTLTAGGIAESGGTPASVQFYLDSDGNAQWDSGDQLIGTATSITGGQASISLNTGTMAAGTYEIFARVVDAAGHWSNAVSAALVVTAANNGGASAATALSVNVGGTVSGALSTPGAVQWFKFQAVAGKNYILQTSLGTLPDSFLTLYGQDGRTALAQNDDIAPGNYASRILWNAPASGTFYVAVSSYNGSYSGSYTLQVLAKNGPPTLAAIANQTMPPGGALAIPLSSASPNGLPLSYFAEAFVSGRVASNIAATVSGNTLTVRPSASFNGTSFLVQVTVSDGLEVATRTFSVTLAKATVAATSKATAVRPTPLMTTSIGDAEFASMRLLLASGAVDAVFARMQS
jgi:subtilisin family serine protease